jgi:hypothetical protein
MAIPFGRAVTPTVAQAAEKAGEVLLENGFDRGADAGPQAFPDQVEPGLPGQ